MPDILIVSDAAWVRAEVESVLEAPETTIRELTRGPQVLPALKERLPDLVVLDQQIGKMGAMAVCQELHQEEGAGRLPHVPVLILLDRRADVFLARRTQADGWVIKPLDPMRLSRAITTLLAGGTYYDESYRPTTVTPLSAR